MRTEKPILKPKACLICEHVYQQSFSVGEIILEPHTPSERVEYKKCPNCGFDPQFMIDIDKIIKERTTMTLSADKQPKINTEDISSYIIVRLKKSWPSTLKSKTD